ncbi:DUF1062 domain-containing protein [Klebsiella pneumoniae]|uniref:DUF1062 domain-containing protein n=1 Tax=Klebsiella pneumoniae TaxID=573 RepID=UPI001463CB13|nr:DUF1062 domain-containing protein [Klebsiella pneumoniae]HEO9328371.1 DUF1062 domain-containing protein [Klebsiella pneumoniae subsp. pneumoniae]MCM6068568.1 DUF1062 domain-containing protein [Klebsiella pneumoniae]MCP6613558.1 DUF1062 domain-containing protein [Klebsiella pneumoniae]MDE1083040.1 DUF1062 domain-containing protein [Klebsiella pneumoniae]MDE1087922.1 DUF1062 domain-containing protein [Klebsiella pneumoniae]
MGYQHIAKRCPACNVKRDFAPSGAIRVNSQKKLLDIWSIYKCTHCDYTWNIALFSRLHVSKINRELLQRLLQNDAAMVHYYAADLATLKRNRAEPSGQPDFRIHEQWSVTLMAYQRITVRVRVSQPFRISLLSILKKQLKLSAAEIRWLVATGHIEGISLKQLKTKKLKAMEYDFQLAAETLYARRRITLSLCGR